MKRTPDTQVNVHVAREETIQGRLSGLANIPLSFLGFALWRSWVSLLFANPAPDLPPLESFDKLIYDSVLALCAILIAITAKHSAPLSGKRWAYLACGVAMTASTLLRLAAIVLPVPSWLAIVGIVLAAPGSALLILLWCELYSFLNPLRIAIYLALSMMLGVLLTFYFEGLKAPWLYLTLLALPLLSLVCAKRAFTLIPEQDTKAPRSFGVFPWKFVTILALYATVNGICTARLGSDYGSIIGSHATISTLVAAGILFLLAYRFSDKFDFSILYKSPMVLMVCGLLLIPFFGFDKGIIGAVLVSISSTFFSLIVFLLLCDISKRLGVFAIWLFGIEEACICFDWAGTGIYLGTHQLLTPAVADTVLGAFALIIVVVFSFLLLRNGEIDEKWGVRFMGNHSEGDESESVHLMRRCEELAAECHLSLREQEVMKLLAQGKSYSIVSRELYIAEGTVKSHTRHIYQKLSITSRKELFAVLGIDRQTNPETSRDT